MMSPVYAIGAPAYQARIRRECKCVYSHNHACSCEDPIAVSMSSSLDLMTPSVTMSSLVYLAKIVQSYTGLDSGGPCNYTRYGDPISMHG